MDAHCCARPTQIRASAIADADANWELALLLGRIDDVLNCIFLPPGVVFLRKLAGGDERHRLGQRVGRLLLRIDA